MSFKQITIVIKDDVSIEAAKLVENQEFKGSQVCCLSGMVDKLLYIPNDDKLNCLDFNQWLKLNLMNQPINIQ